MVCAASCALGFLRRGSHYEMIIDDAGMAGWCSFLAALFSFG